MHPHVRKLSEKHMTHLDFAMLRWCSLVVSQWALVLLSSRGGTGYSITDISATLLWFCRGSARLHHHGCCSQKGCKGCKSDAMRGGLCGRIKELWSGVAGLHVRHERGPPLLDVVVRTTICMNGDCRGGEKGLDVWFGGMAGLSRARRVASCALGGRRQLVGGWRGSGRDGFRHGCGAILLALSAKRASQ